MTNDELTEELRSLADEVERPLICDTPAYGAPGHAHCAACCYGTGVVVTCHEDEVALSTAEGMRYLADLLDEKIERPTTLTVRVDDRNPGHVRGQLFVGRNGGARGNSGEVVLRTDEYEDLRRRGVFGWSR